MHKYIPKVVFLKSIKFCRRVYIQYDVCKRKSHLYLCIRKTHNESQYIEKLRYMMYDLQENKFLFILEF